MLYIKNAFGLWEDLDGTVSQFNSDGTVTIEFKKGEKSIKVNKSRILIGK